MGIGARILVVEADSARGTELAMELELRGCRVVVRDSACRAGSAAWDGPEPDAVVVCADAPDAFELVADWESHASQPRVVMIGGEPGVGWSAPSQVHPQEIAEALARILILGPRPPRVRRRDPDAGRPERFPRASLGPIPAARMGEPDSGGIPTEDYLMPPTRRLQRKA